MDKPTESILSSDEVQSSGDGLLQVLTATSVYPSQKAFQLGESFFNRREIRRIRRQKQQPTAASFNCLLHPRSQVNREIIQDHDLSGTQAGSKHLLDIDRKSVLSAAASSRKVSPMPCIDNEAINVMMVP